MKKSIEQDFEPFLATLARGYAQRGEARIVALLATSIPSIEETDFDNWDGGTYGFTITLQAPSWLYAALGKERESIENQLKEDAAELMRVYPNQWIKEIRVTTALTAEPDWRERAKGWLRGEGVNNQGRVRSDNVASREFDGLLFRSQPEINLYRALKARGVTLFPLPVAIRGGQTYRRIEPDFVILSRGVVMVVEVDGDTVHTESPVEAHDRTTMLVYEGAHVERVRASECETFERAEVVAVKLLSILDRLKDVRK